MLKIDETEKPSSVEEKERGDPGKEFLIKLDQKVSAKFKDCIIEIDVSEKVLRFSFETHILRSRVLAEKLIDTVMIISKRNFFHLMGWCNLVGGQNTCYTAIFLLNCQTDLKRK